MIDGDVLLKTLRLTPIVKSATVKRAVGRCLRQSPQDDVASVLAQTGSNPVHLS